MKDATISELYDLTQTIAAKIFEGKTYPWEVLPLIKDFILELGETHRPLPSTAHASSEKARRSASVLLSAEMPSSARALSLVTPLS